MWLKKVYKTQNLFFLKIITEKNIDADCNGTSFNSFKIINTKK